MHGSHHFSDSDNSFAQPVNSLDSQKININGFANDIERLRDQVYNSLSQNDFLHLLKIERWGKLATFLGYLTAWIIPNPLSAFALSLGQFTRWLLAHHILHKGYDRIPGIPSKYTSKGFANGWRRRLLDWFDWIDPKAWDYEHNILHHYNTGEKNDPDLVEPHLEFLRSMKAPFLIKYFLMALVAMTWKFTYYAPNTMSVLDPETDKRLKSQHILFISLKNVLDFRNKTVRALWLRCYLPYGLIHFVLIPALFLPLGKTAAIFVLINKIMAELMTNIHSFMVIGPNHTADDLHRFEFHYKGKKEFYTTQVLSSANYNCGNDYIDFMSLWLNYQIEHHIFPDLPMSKYREIQPKIKALCKKHGLPYVQESIFKRFARMLDVCVGKTSLRKLESL